LQTDCAAREQHGLERLAQVKFAVLEVGGRITIVPERRDGHIVP
jgi:uncharacterized membrane protein YcaP (DUF421 family)